MVLSQLPYHCETLSYHGCNNHPDLLDESYLMSQT